jgi:beta-N-acetylhexosaminidase
MTYHRLLMTDLAGSSISADERAFFSAYQVGGICLFRRNFTDRVQAAELTAELRSLLGDDVLIATDQEGGAVVRARDVPFSPGTMLLGAANDMNLTRQIAAATARGLSAMGININFAPVADVNNNPLNPVIGDRSFGSDPQTVARQVVAFVQGTQAEGVAATVKHFPGHGDTATDSHLALPVLQGDMARLESVELIPFKAALRAGVACVMSYHGVVQAIDSAGPATLSDKLMTSLLRGRLGFDGVSFTDALEMKAVADRFGPAESVIRALLAGIDMPLYDVHEGSLKTYEAIFDGLSKALAEGRLGEELLAPKLTRLKRLARRYSAKANPDAAWQPGDERLLKEVAQKAVIKLGSGPALNPGKIAVVTAAGQVGGAASDTVSSPAEQFIQLLKAKGFTVTVLSYDPRVPAQDEARILTAVAQSPVTLFISASRTRMCQTEVAFASTVARQARQFWHIALWNPYHVSDLPEPAVISFGFWPVSQEAALEVLLGAPARGTLPIPLNARSSTTEPHE